MFEKYRKWGEKKLKKLTIVDVKLIKLSVAAFTLMLAKLFPGLLGLEWYWYAGLGIAFMYQPMMKALEK